FDVVIGHAHVELRFGGRFPAGDGDGAAHAVSFGHAVDEQRALGLHGPRTVFGEVRFTQDLPFELRVGELVAFEIVLVEVLLHEFFAELEGVDRHLEIYGAGGGIDGGHALRAGGFDVFQRGAGEEAEANR